ncbi:MAG: endonuclease, partial [Planctomycetota bacterium]
MPNLWRAPLFILSCALHAAAQTTSFAPPDGYYDSAVGSGDALRDQLHEIIDAHIVRSYGGARSALQEIDEAPGDPGSILLAYEARALDVSELIASGIRGWDSGRTWNREHTWPRSRGVGSSGADNSDLHALRPADPGVNSARSNLNFGGAFGLPFGRTTDAGAAVWYPGDADAGLVARSLFYMDVRYDGSDGSTEDLSILPGIPSSTGPHIGNLDRLLQWHYQAAPDEFERRRNDVIYDAYQRNRNPFIDRPEYAWSVFVDQANDSQIALSGAEVAADGSSSVAVDLGRVLVGAELAPHELLLSKSGDAGTYFDATTSGSVTSTLDGRRNAFAMGAAAPRSFAV